MNRPALKDIEALVNSAGCDCWLNHYPDGSWSVTTGGKDSPISVEIVNSRDMRKTCKKAIDALEKLVNDDRRSRPRGKQNSQSNKDSLYGESGETD